MNTRKQGRKRKHISVAKTIVFIVFLLYAVSLLFPIVWGFLMSMLTRAEFNAASGSIKFPSGINLKNYVLAWKELSSNGISLVTMTLNSIWYAAGSSFLCVVFSAMTAYVTTKYQFPGRKFFHGFAWVTMMIPIMGNMASSLRFFRRLGVADTLLYVVFSVSVLSYLYVVLCSTFRGLSWEYAESAFVDGAGHFRVFFQIMLPQVYSPIVALFISEFIGKWNDSMTPLIYFPSMPTLASGLYVYQTVASRAVNYPMLFAALIMCMIPVLILFFLFQESLMDIQLGGGIKG